MHAHLPLYHEHIQLATMCNVGKQSNTMLNQHETQADLHGRWPLQRRATNSIAKLVHCHSPEFLLGITSRSRGAQATGALLMHAKQEQQSHECSQYLDARVQLESQAISHFLFTTRHCKHGKHHSCSCAASQVWYVALGECSTHSGVSRQTAKPVLASTLEKFGQALNDC